jgi:toxin CptA
MHGAPSVSYPVGRSRFAAGLLAAAWLLGCAAALLWWPQSPDSWRLGAMLGALAATGLAAAWNWWRQPCGVLAWDGDAWSWSAHPGGAAGRIDVAIDLQHTLLVRWVAAGASRWLWLARTDRAERWNDLRRAVYSRARPQALQPGGPPAATP